MGCWAGAAPAAVLWSARSHKNCSRWLPHSLPARRLCPQIQHPLAIPQCRSVAMSIMLPVLLSQESAPTEFVFQLWIQHCRLIVSSTHAQTQTSAREALLRLHVYSHVSTQLSVADLPANCPAGSHAQHLHIMHHFSRIVWNACFQLLAGIPCTGRAATALS